MVGKPLPTSFNRDVPQHVVQKILDHDSAQMTAHYANSRELHQTGEEAAGQQLARLPGRRPGRPDASVLTWEDLAVIPSDARFAHQGACIRREGQKRSDEGTREFVAEVRVPGAVSGGFQYRTPPERLSDKTVREHWEKARKVGAEGQPVQVRADGPLGDAAWAKQRLSRATQALPNGYCELPLAKTCPHANSCLTCPMFVTSAEFLPQHHAQRQQTLQIITAAEANGQARVAEMNRQVARNLDKIITALEDGGQDRKEEAANAS